MIDHHKPRKAAPVEPDPTSEGRPGLDLHLAERLRRSADARIAEQIEAAKQRREYRFDTRATFAARRRIGVDSRNAARAARLRLIANHQQTQETP